VKSSQGYGVLAVVLKGEASLSPVDSIHVLVGGVLAALALQALLNSHVLPRLGRLPASGRLPRVAVLVPARNEARRIGAATRGWVAQDYPDHELIVLDDASTDATGARASAAGGRRVRVVRLDELPPGWRGKPHACHRLRTETRAEVLVFADADVRAAPGTLRATVAALDALGADALSALPHHRSASPAVRALVALQNWAPLALVPLWLAAGRRMPFLAVTNGQFLAIRASVYDAAGGFAAVREELAEDAVLGRLLVRLGYRVALLDGAEILRCRPYRRFGDLWRANVRNLRAAFLGSRTLLLVVAVAACGLALTPPALLAWGLATRSAPSLQWTWLPLTELALLVLPRAISDRRAGYGPWLALTHPAALTVTAAMAIAAAFGRGTVEWRGRHYTPGRHPG
jgi:chlorobactene glucosyltransferase